MYPVVRLKLRGKRKQPYLWIRHAIWKGGVKRFILLEHLIVLSQYIFIILIACANIDIQTKGLAIEPKRASCSRVNLV